MSMEDERIRLLLDMGVSRENVHAVVEELGRLEATSKTTADGLDRASKSTLNMGQAALQGGRALQDFGQGGIGGILNNIEGLVSALGGGPGLAGILTAVGLAAYFALPKVKEFFSAIIEGSNAVPRSADGLKRLNEELQANGKALDTLREKQSLTNAELAKFNGLTARQVELEKELTAEKEKQKRAAEVAALKPFGQREAEGERAEAMKALFGDEKDRKVLIDEFTRIFRAEEHGAKGEERKKLGRFMSGLAGGVRPDEDLDRNARRGAEVLVNRAITGGNEQDIRDIVRFLPLLNGPGVRMRRDIEQSALPENLRRQDAEVEKAEAKGRDMHEAAAKRREREKKDQEVRELEEFYGNTGAEFDEVDRRKGVKASEKKAGEAKRAADARSEEAYEDAGRRYKQQLGTVMGSDIDERAAAMAARMRAAGGVTDQNGAFHKATPQQQEEQLALRIGEQIRRMFPQIGGGARGVMASNLARGANQQIDDRLMQAQAAAVREGLNATQVTQQAMFGMVAEFRQLAEQARALQRRAGGLRQRQQPMANNGIN